jgi:hypothetical protein
MTPSDKSSQIQSRNGQPEFVSAQSGSKSNIAIRIWGIAADGKSFSQHVTLRTLSRNGVVIEGVQRELATGEIIGIQYNEQKARVRVNSVYRQTSNCVVAVELLPEQECPWKSLLDLAQGKNRRQYSRHPFSCSVELRSSESGVPMTVSATDMCGSGCYVETASSVPTGTKLIASFWIGHEKKTCECKVRTCDPGYGLGIEFTGLDDEAQRRLQSYLETGAIA